ncbi:hypothetical protein HHK36_019739 [Tetracentron sinense]|uniref:Uncharacterized protein n=1 Tax=Tetracentron sinense TaxID=13715 RepID=A0A835D9V8_TETSI|nr:hypothetical protein HHK36_019739 [Tetracentron sinense]
MVVRPMMEVVKGAAFYILQVSIYWCLSMAWLLDKYEKIEITSWGLSQDIIRDRRRRSKKSKWKDHSPRQLAIESRYYMSLPFSDIELEVHESPGEYKHISGFQDLGVENIACGH